jgi:hypothetical protein
MQKATLGLVILASLFLTGCPVSDLQLLYNSNDEVTEPALVGKWAMTWPIPRWKMTR